MARIQMGKELQEQLLQTTDEGKSIRLMKELIVKQQQDIFQLDKMFVELSTMFDKMVDTVVQLASGTAALGAEISPMLQSSRKMVKNAKTNQELDENA